MNVKLGGGKLQHKAYCEKHSVEQRTKVWILGYFVHRIPNIFLLLSFFVLIVNLLSNLCRLKSKELRS